MNRLEKYLVWAWRLAVLVILLAAWREAHNASSSANTAIYVADEAKEAAQRAGREAERAAQEASDVHRLLRRQ